MDDFEFNAMTCSDKDIVNKELIQSKDRDFKDIVFDCYDNLKSTILVAWNDTMANMDDLFKSDFKKELAKAKDKEVEFSADVDSLDNVFSKLQLRYIIDPDHVSDKYRRVALENTVRIFEDTVKEYDNVRWEILDYLKEELAKEEETFKKALVVYNSEDGKPKSEPGVKKKRGRKKNLASIIIKQLSLKEEDLSTDLFIAQQDVLVPEIGKNYKYRIDGVNYYGVYNNIYTGILTKSRTLGYKTFKDGKFNTPYFGIVNDEVFGDVLYVAIFGARYNPFHVLTQKPMSEINPTDLLVFNNGKKNPKWAKLIQNTYDKALYMDDNEEDFTLDPDGEIGKGIKNKKEMHLPELKFRAHQKERRYKIDINIGCQMLLEKLEKARDGLEQMVDKINFTHLNNLEEAILRHINEENKIPKNQSPTKGAKRINLNPGLIISVIKKNSDEKSSTVLFRDNKKEPNPFDIFQLCAYSQTSNHTQTSSNKHVSSKAKRTGDSNNWIKWYTLPYLSIYFSKNNNPLGKNNILHFDIDSDLIIERNKVKEIFADIYNAKTL